MNRLILEDDQQQPAGWQERGTLRLKWKGMLGEYAPEYLAAWDDWAASIRTRHELDEKSVEFVLIGINAVSLRLSPYIDSHIHKAFNAGATIREMVELAGSVGLAMGPRTMDYILSALYKTIKEREDLNLPTPRTRPDLSTE